DNAVATHLYRIAQEAVSNAIKHGRASRLLLRLRTSHGRTELTVNDQGVGFPKTSHQQPGMGLHIMKYRAGLIGGSLEVKRAPEGGTIVTCWLPAPGPQ